MSINGQAKQCCQLTKHRYINIHQGLLFLGNNGTTCFTPFSLVIEVTTEKVPQFIMPFMPIYNKNLGFIEQKNVLMNITERFQKYEIY
jgi:hypothetical protein